MRPITEGLVIAGLHFFPTLLWGLVAADTARSLRRGVTSSTFSVVAFALACTVTVHFASWDVCDLLRGHVASVLRDLLRGSSSASQHPWGAALFAAMDGSLVLIIAFARHLVLLWPARGIAPGKRWLAVNYGAATVALATLVVAVFGVISLRQLGWAGLLGLFTLYSLTQGLLTFRDLRRLAGRGAWRPSGLWDARSADVVAVGIGFGLIWAVQLIPLAVGMLPQDLLLSSAPSQVALLTFAMHGAAAVLFAAPFVVRNLGDLLPTLASTLAATAGVAGVVAGARA